MANANEWAVKKYFPGGVRQKHAMPMVRHYFDPGVRQGQGSVCLTRIWTMTHCRGMRHTHTIDVCVSMAVAGR